MSIIKLISCSYLKLLYNIGTLKSYLWEEVMNYNLDKEREKRLQSTGKWFDSNKKNYNDIYLTYIIPLVLIISLCATVFIALT